MKTFLLVTCCVLLNACQSIANQRAQYERVYGVPVGSKAMLNQDLQVPAHKARVYIQGGRAIAFSELNQYYPHCIVEMSVPKNIPQVISVDIFDIYKVVRSVDMTAGAGGVVFAALALNGGDDGPSPQFYGTEMFLKSKTQPDVVKLTCGHMEDPTIAEYLTVTEIKNALGGVFTLELAPRAMDTPSGEPRSSSTRLAQSPVEAHRPA
jgi:hypothetical protein